MRTKEIINMIRSRMEYLERGKSGRKECAETFNRRENAIGETAVILAIYQGRKTGRINLKEMSNNSTRMITKQILMGMMKRMYNKTRWKSRESVFASFMHKINNVAKEKLADFCTKGSLNKKAVWRAQWRKIQEYVMPMCKELVSEEIDVNSLIKTNKLVLWVLKWRKITSRSQRK